MTQARNALHASLSGAMKSPVKEAAMRKQAGRQDNGIGHIATETK